jgi:hypothetical protein
VELAKEQASKAEGDDMLRKKLWLKIGENAILFYFSFNNNNKKLCDLFREDRYERYCIGVYWHLMIKHGLIIGVQCLFQNEVINSVCVV